MTVPVFIKDPNAVLPYTLNWALGSDTIASSTWNVPLSAGFGTVPFGTGPFGGGSTAGGIAGSGETWTGTSTIIWLSGGSVGENYTLTNEITTAAGYSNDQTIIVAVRQK